MSASIRTIMVAGCLGLACAGGEGTEGPPAVTGESSEGAMESSTSMVDSSSGDPPTESSEGDSGPVEDTSGGDESGGDETGEIAACTGVDLLFVVNNNAGMLDEQIRLQAVVDAFVQGIAGALPIEASELHLAVIGTDDSNFLVPSTGYNSGLSFMTTSTLIAGELQAALAVGTAGNPDDRPAQRAIEAFADERLAPDGHNHGFLREQALLVVVVVSDEEDDLEAVTQWGSEGEPSQWVTSLADKKGGYTRNVVVLSLVGTEAVANCDAELAPRLQAWSDGFPRGAVGNVCASEYATFLLAQTPLVAEACSDFRM